MKQKLFIWIFVLLLLVVNVSALITDNAISYYKMSNGNDELNHLNMDTINNPSNVAGFIGNAYDFDGASDRMSSSTEPNTYLGGLTAFTVSFWAKSDNIATNSFYVSSSSQFFTQQVSQKLQIVIYGGNGDGSKYIYWDSTNNVITNTSSWFHIVFVFTAPNTMTMYVNGDSVSSTLEGSAGTVSSIASYLGGTLHFGYNVIGSTYFNGKLDEIYLVGRALNSTEVAFLYSAGLSGIQYPFVTDYVSLNTSANNTYYNLTHNYIEANVSTVYKNLSNTTLFLYRDGSLVNSAYNTSGNFSQNFTGLTAGVYDLNATAFNSSDSIYSSTYRIYIGLSQFNLTAYDYSTNGSLSNFSVNVTNLNKSVSQLLNTSGSILSFATYMNDSYTFVLDVPNYALSEINLTMNDSIYQRLNQSLFKTNSIQINIFDESDLSMIASATNVTFISNLSSIVYNTSTGYLFVSNLTPNVYEVKFNNAVYSQRSYYLTVTNRSTQTLNAYLSSSTTNLLLTYVNKETGDLLEGCGVVVAKAIGGVWITVASGFTDITGRVQFTVSTNTNYRFSSSCAEFVDKPFNLNPVIFTSYTIQLTKIASPGSQLDFSNINVYIQETSFSNNLNNTFLWEISAPAGNLESWGYNLSTTCKNISNVSGVNAYGGISVIAFNLTCATTSQIVTLNYYYTLAGGDLRTFSNTYSIQGNNTGQTMTKNQSEHYGMSLIERVLVTILLTIVMAGLITKFSNVISGLVCALFLLGYMSYIGFIEWWLIAPSLFVGFIVITSWSKVGG